MDGWLSVKIVWYTPAVSSDTDPDLDNMAKPYVDGLKGVGGVIPDDNRIRDLRVVKADINFDLQDLPGVEDAKRRPDLESNDGQFVLLLVEPWLEHDAALATEEPRP
jgi:hypothetical protein